MTSTNTPSNNAKITCSLLISLVGSYCVFALLALAQSAGAALSISGPAGLTVVRNGEYNNIVSWHAVPGALSYHLQHRSLYPANLWTDVPGCDPISTTCTDITATTSAYAYRVQASKGMNSTDWSNIAIFLSEPDNDGYVVGPPFSGNSVVPNDVQPGIRAGEKPGTFRPAQDLRGFLSFNSSALGPNTTVLGAKLRLRQFTSNDAFDLLGPCMVDIQTGAFSTSPTLQFTDFYYTDANTTVNAFEIIGVGANEWFEAAVSHAVQISNTDYTQFRIYFNHSDTINEYAGWYSGESDDSPPQLLVRYKEE
jgi:carbohydrate-selective porin OprB